MGEEVSRAAGYAELHCRSAFSLLDGASLPEALAARAAAAGYRALALTDRHDLGGAVRFAAAARGAGLAGIIGAELDVEWAGEARPLVLLAQTGEGYANLSTLVTRARMDRPRGAPAVTFDQVAAHAAGVFALTGGPRGRVPALAAAGRAAEARAALGALADAFGRRAAVECWDHGLEEERRATAALVPLAGAAGLPWVVANDARYAEPAGRVAHDVLAALRHGRTLDAMGTRLLPSAEWHLADPARLYRRWRRTAWGDAGLRATLGVAERCAFRMDQLTPTLPAFPLPPGVTADAYLADLVETGARARWGEARTERQRGQIAHELALIARMGLAGFFLIVYDIVRFARRQGILCQGRGSAANSAVCYCLAITPVDPVAMNLLFERFLSEDRREPPDIDLDFAHRERERVIQYVYETYGREHAAMVCEQITWRGRGAVRDAARVLGFSPAQADALSRFSDRFSARATAAALRAGIPAEDAAAQAAYRYPPAPALSARERREADHRRLVAGAEPPWRDPHADATHEERRNPTMAFTAAADGGLLARCGLDPADPRVRALADVVDALHQLPRHRSIHVGGFVLTREPLAAVVPVEPASMPGRTVIQWEKDDLEPVRLVKIDLLGLGMLTVLQDCLRYVREARGVALDPAHLPMDDPAVYDMLCRADTVGVFQVESRAQMNTLPRLQPRCFYDLVVEVALVRPGPIQGDMVHPYLRRRAKLEAVEYLHEALRPALERTHGVPLFQEQGMQVAITAAGFTPGEADELRRAMGHKRSRERMAEICDKLVAGMARNGIPPDTATRIYNQINAFADYGFPESHAASFAHLVYASAYCKHYHAPEFLCALLNAQPMGFYAPGTLVEDARRHGVRVLPVDVTRSRYESALDAAAGNAAGPAVRLGLRVVRGLGARARQRLADAVAAGGAFTSLGDLVARSGLDRRALGVLAEAGALDAFVPDEPARRRRRAAVWRLLEAARGGAGPLAPAALSLDVPAAVRAMTPFELTAADYRATGVSLVGHPVSHLRAALAPNGVRTARDLVRAGRDGERVAAAGLVICRQRPGTAKGFVFLTLEDETGTVNVVVRPGLFARHALLVSRSPILLVRGRLQVEGRQPGPVVNVRAERFRALAGPGAEHARGHDFH